MKQPVLFLTLVAAAGLALHDVSAAHGGTYRGPVDVVPPAGGGGGGGGGPAPGRAPGNSAPTPHAGGSQTGTPAPALGPKRPQASVTTAGLDSGPDTTQWQYWWGFNKEPYLDLKAHVHAGLPLTGSDDFFLGAGQREFSRDTMAPSPVVVRERIAPALLRALREERSTDILDACLIAVAKIGEERDEGGTAPLAAAIRPFQADAKVQLSETAAVALGILADDSKENVELLRALLEDRSAGLLREHGIAMGGAVPTRTRAFAAFGLGLIGNTARDEMRARIVEALIGFLEGDARTQASADVAVACLTSLGLTPLPVDLAAGPVDVSDGWTRPEVVVSLADQVRYLMSFYEDRDGRGFLVRAHVPTAVGRLLAAAPDDSWLRDAVIARFVADLDEFSGEAREVQQSCVQALGQLADCDDDPGDVRIRAALMAIADGSLADQQARNYALIALGRAGGRAGHGAGDPFAALAGPARANPRSFLIGKLARAKSAARPWAALALAVLERSRIDAGRQPSADVRAALRTALKDARSPVEIGGLAVAVGIAQDAAAGEVLRAQLKRTADDEARGFCALALGLVGDQAAVQSIEELIAKAKYRPHLLKAGAIGLGLLGDKAIVPELVSMLEQASALSAQAAIASALGFIGDERSVDPLIALLADEAKTDLARGFAAAALGIVADKERLPWNTKIAVGVNYTANTATLTLPQNGTGILDLL